MSLFQKFRQALADRDPSQLEPIFHDDLVFLRHKTGTSLDRQQVLDMMAGMAADENVRILDHRLIYENGEILVHHLLVAFPDGSREAVLEASLLKDGKIVRMETGATPVKA